MIFFSNKVFIVDFREVVYKKTWTNVDLLNLFSVFNDQNNDKKVTYTLWFYLTTILNRREVDGIYIKHSLIKIYCIKRKLISSTHESRRTVSDGSSHSGNVKIIAFKLLSTSVTDVVHITKHVHEQCRLTTHQSSKKNLYVLSGHTGQPFENDGLFFQASWVSLLIWYFLYCVLYRHMDQIALSGFS